MQKILQLILEGLSGMEVTWCSARRSITWDWLSSYFLPLVIVQRTHLNTTPAVPDLDRNKPIQTMHLYTGILGHKYPFVLLLLPTHICCLPWSAWCQFYTTLLAEYVGLNYHSVKRKEFACYFSWLESCPSHQTMPNHVQGHKNEVPKPWIKICNGSLKSATVLQPCKVTGVSLFQKGPQGFLESYRLKCCMLVNSFRC